ncbi:MAG: hypothetical protein AMXMBFR81_25660 [Chthonomonas sp.]
MLATRSRVSGETRVLDRLPFRIEDTVAELTPAASATSLSVVVLRRFLVIANLM